MITFERLREKWHWKPIANCPGRFVLSADRSVNPEELLGAEVQMRSFHVSGARDEVLIFSFGDGGVISYKRSDGTYVHTLSTAEGFKRKITQLGIEA